MNTTSPLHGLSRREAEERLRREGYNELAADQGRPLHRIVVSVAGEPMFLLLIASGLIYLLMGDGHEALILLGFVTLIMAVTVLQESRTERALKALREIASPRALVVRNGVAMRIPGREVVRGDLLMLSEGDRVAADGTLLEAHDLAVDESLLSGESVAAIKGAGENDDARVYAGTLAVRGQGLVRVDAIGAATELGRIGKSLAEIDSTASPLQREIALLTRRLLLWSLALCLGLAILFITVRGGWLHGLLAGITLAMSILPQEFPVTLTVFLALGARRIARQQVLTRHLSAIETLGETTVLCTDKTGTLTRNRMTVAALYADGRLLDLDGDPEQLPEHFHILVEFGVLASEAAPHDPMEQAFHRLARDTLANTEHLHPDWELVREYELSPEMLAMSHLWQTTEEGTHAVAAKGAPEAIVDLCHLPRHQQQEILAQAQTMADRGLRVLGCARARHDTSPWPAQQHDFDFEFLGLVGLADPLRPEVPAAVAECRNAGIRVMMITGDHPRTALAIAAQAGLATDRVITGHELENLPAQALAERLGQDCIFARVSPQQKLLIVEALKARGEVVAMTGDGVNDAPALKAAHIGIAMGHRGTDVAREAAALVLLEDDFSAIVASIRQGRRIFANLRQAMIYTLAVHIPIIGLSVLPILFGWPLLLMPIHIATLELLIDPACSIAFEAEPGSQSLMRVPPRRRSEALISVGHLRLSLFQGVLATALAALSYGAWLWTGTPEAEAKALAFITLVVGNTALIFCNRSVETNLWSRVKNISPAGRSVAALAVLSVGIIVLVPTFAGAFGFAPPSLFALATAAALGTLVLPLFLFSQTSRHQPR